MIKIKDFILNTFLTLTSETYPYGTEDIVFEKIKSHNLLPENVQKDQHGNYFVKIGESRTIFASHLDTVCKEHTQVVHQFDGEIIKTDGKTTLGADDKAGVTIMLFMIQHNVPGLYYFFIGEEVGCIGSGLAAKYGDFKGKYDRIISFDRKGTNSVITYQSSSRSCSDDFAKQLAKELNQSGLTYILDDTGVYTDSAEFVSVIPECTNLSVGYYNEHTFRESQDISHLEKLAKACLKVDWENLVTKRDMSKLEMKSYYSKTYATYDSYESSDWRSRDFDYGYSRSRKKRNRRRKNNNRYYDDWYDQNTSSSSSYDNNWTSFIPAGKSYYDGVDGLVEINKSDKNDFSYYSYDWIMTKFVDKKLDYETLQIIKEQYLDFSNPQDKDFYNYLLDVATEQDQ